MKKMIRKIIIATAAAALTVTAISGCGKANKKAAEKPNKEASPAATESVPAKKEQKERNEEPSPAVTKSVPTREEQREQMKNDTSARHDILYYFVSKNDARYDEEMAMINKLKSEYEGRMTFNIIDIDENSEQAAIVTGLYPDGAANHTPVFMMNDFTSGVNEKCVDEALIRESIEFVLN